MATCARAPRRSIDWPPMIRRVATASATTSRSHAVRGNGHSLRARSSISSAAAIACAAVVSSGQGSRSGSPRRNYFREVRDQFRAVAAEMSDAGAVLEQRLKEVDALV